MAWFWCHVTITVLHVTINLSTTATKTFHPHVKWFELNLRYLEQRKYRPGEMYWMTFPWPWPNITAVALMNKNLLVCMIKFEPLIKSLQDLTAISPGHAYFKFQMCYFKVKRYWKYLRRNWCYWHEMKRRCIGWILVQLCELDHWPQPWSWHWIFQSLSQ